MRRNALRSAAVDASFCDAHTMCLTLPKCNGMEVLMIPFQASDPVRECELRGLETLLSSDHRMAGGKARWSQSVSQ